MTLRYFYRIAAGCFLATIAVLTTLNAALAMVGREGMAWIDNPPFLIRLPLGILGAAGAVGIVSLWFGMMWDCLLADSLVFQGRMVSFSADYQHAGNANLLLCAISEARTCYQLTVVKRLKIPGWGSMSSIKRDVKKKLLP